MDKYNRNSSSNWCFFGSIIDCDFNFGILLKMRTSYQIGRTLAISTFDNVPVIEFVVQNEKL